MICVARIWSGRSMGELKISGTKHRESISHLVSLGQTDLQKPFVELTP